MPCVSVVIPVYNRCEPLSRALRSLQQQSFKDFEILVVDDHSTVNLRPYLEQFSVRYMKTVGKGVSAARNTGIHASSSEFIAFLDSDDEWLPLKLEKQMEYFSLNQQHSIVHTNEIWFREGKVVKQNSRQQKFGGRLFSRCTEQCLIAPSSTLIRRALLNQVGLFDESFPVCEDFDLWLRISATEEIGFLSEPLVIKHGGHEDQLSRQYHSMDLWRVRALAKHMTNQNLNREERLALYSNLRKKCEILLKGFEKHKNFIDQAEILQHLDSLKAVELQNF